jgi:hypothetical protein
MGCLSVRPRTAADRHHPAETPSRRNSRAHTYSYPIRDWRERLVCSKCGSRNVDMVVIGTEQWYHVLCRACGSNRSACQVMIEAADPTIKRISDPAYVPSCGWAGRLHEVLGELVINDFIRLLQSRTDTQETQHLETGKAQIL